MVAVENYINKRYDRWLDYAVYHCTHAGMQDEANDVLNEVLLSLVRKEKAELDRLLTSKQNGYTELDFFVLRMIKLNATSDTSPYRSKYRNKVLLDANKDYMSLKIIDEPYMEIDFPAISLWQFKLIRFILRNIEVSRFDKAVFEYRFIKDRQFSELNWNIKQLYISYNKVHGIIRKILLDLGIAKPLAQEKSYSKAEKLSINKAARSFLNKIDKQLLEKIKKYNVMEDDELELENLHNDEGERDDLTKDWSEQDFIDAFNRDTAKEPGCATLELE